MYDWLKNRIVYQIFPDLFCRYDDNISLPRGYHGGNLKGIISKLDYIKDWGFDVIYLNPVFKAFSSHRYDVLDFYQIDPILGSIEDFEDFVREAHNRGIKIILDIPFNHVSENHIWFTDVLNNPNSKYRGYFVFDGEQYNRWRGSNLVELNLDNLEVLEYLVLGENSVLKFWISKGIDGVRLDCANDIGTRVSQIIRDTAHSVKRDFLVMGEVFNYAEEWCNYLDSIQSYYLTSLIFSLVKNEISIQSFSNGVDFVVQNYNYDILLNSLNILSSHDTTRILDVIGDDIDIYRIILSLQFTLPGVPVVLYGEEVGISSGSFGERSARKVMIWDENRWNHKVISLYKSFLNLRRSRIEFQEGFFRNISSVVDYEFFAFLRFTRRREEFSIVLINPSDKIVEKKLFIPYSHFHDAIKVIDYFSGKDFLCEVSSIRVKLLPFEVMVLVPDWKYIKGYSFYKRQ
ncbi:MAG: alpha-amylase family glycosyl hydrolase [Brevinematia bacterium]